MKRSEIFQLLQDYCSGKIKATKQTFNDGNYIALGKYGVPNDALTPLKIYGKENEYYTVESLIYLWENKDEAHTSYVKNAGTVGIKPVTKVDKREIIKYLSGTSTELPSIYDTAWIPVVPVPISRYGENGEPAAKKIKMEPVDEYTEYEAPVQLKIKEEPMEDNERAPESQPTHLNITEERREEIRGLSDILTSDKILQLKKKKQENQKKAKKIANVEKDIFDNFSVIYTPRKEEFQEITYEDRGSILESSTMIFTNIFGLLNEIQITDRSIMFGTKETNHAVQHETSMPAMPRYDRYDQEVFAKEEVSAYQSFVGQDFNNLGAVMSAEVKDEEGDIKPTQLTPVFPRQPVTKRTVPESAQKKDLHTLKRFNGPPIIIIPAAGNMSGTLINMYNAMEILQNLKFVDPMQRKAEGARNEPQILIRRQFNGKNVSYRVIENPLRLKSDEWDRVVAIFAMGPLWQFKGWKWNGNPIEIFSRIPAFHLYYEDLSLDKNVAKMNVTPIAISRDRRHLDRSRLIKFWEIVDRHIMKTNCSKRY